MSRSGYDEDYDGNDVWLYRGAVTRAIKGRRGQAFLKEALAALDAMPVKRLIADELACEGGVCLLGAVGVARGVNMDGLNPEDAPVVAAKFGIAEAMAREVVFENDEGAGYWSKETPEQRFDRMRRWIVSKIAEAAAP